jgi:outer membrane protein assembly factor BamB
VRFFLALLVCGCLPDPRGRCASDADCAGGPAGAFCAEGVCQGPPRGTVEPLPARVFARSETVHVRARIDRSHGDPTARVLLGTGAVAAAREADGALGADLPLRLAPAGSEGAVPFAVEVKDDLGHATMLASTVQVDDRAPRVTVDAASVPSAAVVRGSKVSLRVVVEDLTPVTVFWTAGSGQAAAVQQADGSFVAQVDTKSAPAGATVLDVAFTATDAVGNASTVHVAVALTRLKFSTPHKSQVVSIVVSDVIWAMATQTEVWILRRDGTSIMTAPTGGAAFPDLATDGSRLFYGRTDNQICRMGSDGTIQLCCGPFATLNGGPTLLGTTPVVSTRGTSLTSSRLYAMTDVGGGNCQTAGSKPLADFGGTMPAVGKDGIVYSGASQAIATGAFDSISWTERATSESPRYRGQPAIRGQTVLLSTTTSNVDAYAFVDPINSPAPPPVTTQIPGGIVVLTSPTIAADGTATVATDDRRVIALRPDGTIRWTASLPDSATAPPTHGAGNLIYVGTLSGDIVALSADDGSTVWSQPAGAPVRGPLAPGCDGLLYAGTDAAVLALVIDAPGLADSTWPRAGHDIRGTSDARRPLRSANGACLE